jgi:hypothetical protein
MPITDEQIRAVDVNPLLERLFKRDCFRHALRISAFLARPLGKEFALGVMRINPTDIFSIGIDPAIIADAALDGIAHKNADTVRSPGKRALLLARLQLFGEALAATSETSDISALLGVLKKVLALPSTNAAIAQCAPALSLLMKVPQMAVAPLRWAPSEWRIGALNWVCVGLSAACVIPCPLDAKVPRRVPRGTARAGARFSLREPDRRHLRAVQQSTVAEGVRVL